MVPVKTEPASQSQAARHQPDENSTRVYGELMKIFVRLYERLEPEFATISRFRCSM